MGKSPGKWMKSLLNRMKGILFSNKSSKPELSQGRQRVGKGKEVHVPSKTSEEGDLTVNPTTFSIIQGDVGWHEENHGAKYLTRESVPDIQNENFQETADVDGQKYAEIIGLKSVIKIQAAFRGYLARRAFRAVRYIIKLQALVRGHLVRRQAVSTLKCMLGIVKIQNIARGKRIGRFHNGIQLGKNYTFLKNEYSEAKIVHPIGIGMYAGITNLSANIFARKLLDSSPTAMPLHLQYKSWETNSVLKWLERWSESQFWKPVKQIKQVQQPNTPTTESEKGRGNPYVQKSPIENADSVSARSSEFEKTKYIMKKFTIPSANCLHKEDPKLELEKVKRSLRKIHNPIVESTIQSEIRKGSSTIVTTGQNASEYTVTDFNEVRLPDTKRTLKPIEVNAASNMVEDDQIASKMDSLWSIDEGGRVSVSNEELAREGDLISNEIKKPGRRSWFQAKEAVLENRVRGRNMLPSYMAATQSAKAKLREQRSPTSGRDELEKNISSRRHYANVQGGNRNDKSSVFMGNGIGKANQVEWRRY